MTDQEIFDTVYRHFILNGGKLSYRIPNNYKIEDDLPCLYRGENGEKCAIGVCLPDEYYSKRVEGKAAWAAIEISPRSRMGRFFKNNNTSLLGSLQRSHDAAAVKEVAGEEWFDDLRMDLEAHAVAYGLTVPKE